MLIKIDNIFTNEGFRTKVQQIMLRISQEFPSVASIYYTTGHSFHVWDYSRDQKYMESISDYAERLLHESLG